MVQKEEREPHRLLDLVGAVARQKDERDVRLAQFDSIRALRVCLRPRQIALEFLDRRHAVRIGDGYPRASKPRSS